MKASVVELRYKMKEILKALGRNEEVKILYHGKLAGTIVPPSREKVSLKAENHPAFGMYAERYKNKSISAIMDELRGGRYRDV